MRTFVLFVVLLGVMLSPVHVMCQNPYAQMYDVSRTFLTPATSTEAAACPAPGVSTTIDPAYPTGFQVTSSSACVQSYEQICRTPSGAVRCNRRDGRCRDTERTSTALYPALEARGTGTVEQCVSEGEYQHPDANAVLVAQCVFSFVVIVICVILVLIRTWQHLDWFVRIWFLFMSIICILLLPSYYYLNGLIGIAAAILAVVMFSTREPTPAAIGITACIAAIMWFTFDSGLGFLLHSAHLRFSDAGNPTIAVYETFCDRYFRFSYHIPLPLLSDNTNTVEVADGVCLRGWLSTELFFAVLLILSFVVLGVAGTYALTHNRKITNPDSEVTPTSHSA